MREMKLNITALHEGLHFNEYKPNFGCTSWSIAKAELILNLSIIKTWRYFSGIVFLSSLLMGNFSGTQDGASGIEVRSELIPIMKKIRRINYFLCHHWSCSGNLVTGNGSILLVDTRNKNQKKYHFWLFKLWYSPVGPDPPCMSFLQDLRDLTGASWVVRLSQHLSGCNESATCSAPLVFHHPPALLFPRATMSMKKWAREYPLLPYLCQVSAGRPGLSFLSLWPGFLCQVVRQQGVEGFNH